MRQLGTPEVVAEEAGTEKVVGLDGNPHVPTETQLETRDAEMPAGHVDIYEYLSASELPKTNNANHTSAPIAEKRFYFRVETEGNEPHVLVEAIKSSALEGYYTFNLYKEGGGKEAVASISSHGSKPLNERAPLEKYLKRPTGALITRKAYFAATGIARVVQRAHSSVEEIIYSQ